MKVKTGTNDYVKPVEIFSSKFFEMLRKQGADESIITGFLIYRTKKLLKECGQKKLAAEIEKRCDGLAFAACLQTLREYVNFRDADKTA